MRTTYRIVGAVIAVALIAVVVFAGNIAFGMHAVSSTSGTISGLALQAPVEIKRDARGVPHIRAQNEHDLFFADGYVEAADRAFQLDLLRRFVYGRLSELLGSAALSTDEGARTVPVAQLVQVQWERLRPHDREVLQAFADGVNAALQREPRPVEFRILMYNPRPWTPQDSLAVGFATVLDLTDTWDDIAGRAHQHLPLSDPCYDAPVTTGLAHIADPKHCGVKTAFIDELIHARAPLGSNEWGVGATHSATGHALLENDPHLRIQIPGVWYLIDLQAPSFHVAGASLAGTPGVILGHNDRVAWGATNGSVASLSAFEADPAKLDGQRWQSERFQVRLGGTVTKRFYRARDVFGAETPGRHFVLVKWPAYTNPVSPLPTFDALDRSTSIEDALRGLRVYPGPTQNFEIADTSGRVAYHLAGAIPNDPIWARTFHPASDISKTYEPLPFDALPNVAPSRDAVVWTANNKMYGAGYPYQLSPQFSPPYRAYRIATMLRSRAKMDVPYFMSMQMDQLSIPELELAGYFKQLRNWDGRFTPGSKDATSAYTVRRELVQQRGDIQSGVLAARDQRGVIATLTLPASPKPWSEAGAVSVKHPLSVLGVSFLNGTTFAGNGDAYTVHVQNYGFSQSFRAVWDIGNWDAGGIIIPQGESGEPGSRHYTDEAADWVAGRLPSLPYSDAAVDRATVEQQTLKP